MHRRGFIASMVAAPIAAAKTEESDCEVINYQLKWRQKPGDKYGWGEIEMGGFRRKFKAHSKGEAVLRAACFVGHSALRAEEDIRERAYAISGRDGFSQNLKSAYRELDPDTVLAKRRS